MFAKSCLSHGDKQSTKELIESDIKYGLIDSDASSHAGLMKCVDACKHIDAYVEEAHWGSTMDVVFQDRLVRDSKSINEQMVPTHVPIHVWISVV